MYLKRKTQHNRNSLYLSLIILIGWDMRDGSGIHTEIGEINFMQFLSLRDNL